MSRKNRRAEFTPEPVSTTPSVLENQARRMREQSREQFWSTLELLPENERTAFWNAKYIKDVIDQYGEPDRARYEHRGQHKDRRLKA